MGTSPPPRSIRPKTEQIDESWDDLVIGALGEPPEPEDDDVFDRATAIPNLPPGLEASRRAEAQPEAEPGDPLRLPSVPPLGSEPPELGGRLPLRGAGARSGDSDAHSAATITPVRRRGGATPAPDARAPAPGSRSFDDHDERRRTAPEPIVERFLERSPVGGSLPGHRALQRPHGDGLELDLGETDDSPLELAETYRRVSESMPTGDQAAAAPESVRPNESGTRQDMQDRYAVGDFTGALVVAESILDADPENEDARRYAQSCREVLTQMYAARIGPMDQVATVAVPPEQITWLSLDHRAGFLLSLVDGVSSIEEILDISGMTRLDALRIMYTLVQQNVITLAAQ